MGGFIEQEQHIVQNEQMEKHSIRDFDPHPKTVFRQSRWAHECKVNASLLLFGQDGVLKLKVKVGLFHELAC